MSDPLKNHPLASQFNRLTPDQVLDAVEVIGERCTGRFLALNSYENRVYQFELENGQWVVGKFYRPGRWTRAAIQQEHSFLAELAEVEIPVSCPLEIEAGSTIGEVQGIFYALYSHCRGRAPEEFSDEQLQILGRLIARVHNVGATRLASDRIQLTPATYGRDNFDYLLKNKVLPDEAREGYQATIEALLDRIEPLWDDLPLLRIHGDCHLGNLLWRPQGPTFLDFDDLVNGPAVQDIWMLVPSFDSEGQRQRLLLLDAYQEFREFKMRWLRLIEPLRALRYIHYATWIARRWHDPIFQRTFNHFGTLQYWQGQMQDLREQIARIDEDLD